MSGSEASFKQHFSELTGYLKPVALVFVLVFAATFYLSPILISYAREVTSVQLVTLHPYEILSTRIKIGFYTGVFATLPTATIQIYRFFRPALSVRERKTLKILMPIVFLLVVSGGLVGFVFLSELTSEFLRGLTAGTGVVNTWSISNVISYMLKLSLAAILIFNIPVFVVGLVKLGLLDISGLKSYRAEVLVGSVAFAAVISPPDFLSMIILSLPAYLFYELGIKIAALL